MEEQKKRRGRPRKTEQSEAVTVEGKKAQQQAEAYRNRKKGTDVIDQWYELRNDKLLQCFKRETGSVRRVYVGNRASKKNRAQIQEFIKKIESEGLLRKV